MNRNACAIALVGIAITTVTMAHPLATSAKPTTVAPASAVASPALMSLTRHLKKVNAKMYGAYWCPHCTRQKELFGASAIQYVNYIECDPQGKNAKPDLCKAANIKGYPTWEIKGKQYTGVQSLEELAKLSGYKGSTNF
jgi:glutaredoxin